MTEIITACYFNCIFKGNGIGIPYWNIQGTTIVTAQYVRLTADTQSVQGGIWNNVVSRFTYLFVRCIAFSSLHF